MGNEFNRHGWINVYKDKGISSNSVLSKIKRILNINKVGHLGTLDPSASGVLPIALGEATKVIHFITDHRKSYRFTINFGYQTDTYDDEGEVVAKNDFVPTVEMVKGVLCSFIGEIRQKPPVYSAIKLGGKRSYQLAREGIEVDMPDRVVNISDIRFISSADNQVVLEADCSKGTYIRSLGVDIAGKLGAFATVSDIIRLRSGKFNIDNAIRLEFLEKMVHNFKDFCCIKNITWVLDDIPVFHVDESDVTRIRQGQAVEGSDKASYDCYAITLSGGVPVAICYLSNGALLPKRVFNIC